MREFNDCMLGLVQTLLTYFFSSPFVMGGKVPANNLIAVLVRTIISYIYKSRLVINVTAALESAYLY